MGGGGGGVGIEDGVLAGGLTLDDMSRVEKMSTIYVPNAARESGAKVCRSVAAECCGLEKSHILSWPMGSQGRCRL
jgi:hypothetical protein